MRALLDLVIRFSNRPNYPANSPALAADLLNPEITARTAVSASQGPAKRPPADFMVKVNESIGDFAVFILTSISKALDLMVSIEGEVASDHAFSEARLFGWTGSPESSEHREEARAIREMAKLLLTHENVELRCRALASLVYFMRSGAIVQNSQHGVHADDMLVISRVLLDSAAKEEITQEVQSWASSTIGHADTMLSRGLQDRIEAEFLVILGNINSLSTCSSGKKTSKQSKELKAD